MKNIFFILINTIIIYFFTLWLIENIDIEKLRIVFLSVPMTTIIIVFCVNFLTLLFYSKRLSTILDKNFFTSFSLVNLGYGLNAIIPFRMGEIAKLLYAKKIFNIPSSQLLVSVLIEKILDILFLGLLLSLFFIFSVQKYISSSVLFGILGFLIITMIFLFIARKSILKLQENEKRNGKIKNFLIAIYRYSKGHNIKKLFVESGLIWGSNIIAVYITFNTILSIEFSVINAIGLLIVLVFSIAIPATPAGIGIFEAGIVAYLVTIFGIDNEVALVSAILFHTAVIIPQLIIMLITIGFWKINKGIN